MSPLSSSKLDKYEFLEGEEILQYDQRRIIEQVSKICKAFAKGLSANITFSKNELSKIKSREFIYSEFFLFSHRLE